MAGPTALRVVSNRLPRLSGALRDAVGDVVARTSLTIERDAKQMAPVDTGALRASIQAEGMTDLSWRVAVGVAYGVYQEYGTVHASAQPYLTPAAERARQPFVTAMKRLLT